MLHHVTNTTHLFNIGNNWLKWKYSMITTITNANNCNFYWIRKNKYILKWSKQKSSTKQSILTITITIIGRKEKATLMQNIWCTLQKVKIQRHHYIPYQPIFAQADNHTAVTIDDNKTVMWLSAWANMGWYGM